METQFDNYSFLIVQAPASLYKDKLVFIVNGSTKGQGRTYPFKPAGFYYSDGSTWIFKGATSTGGTGTVTSVDITTNAGAITITGNPITTAGTIDLDFNGAITDYIDGTGALQVFPTIPSGTVTNVAALTLGTTGTDLSSTVANPTTTPVITLNVPNASATNRGVLTSTQYSTLSTKSFGIVIDGGGTPITTGIAGDVVIPFAMTITSWTLIADQVGSIVIDLWKDTYANYPPTVADTITGSEKPTLSSVIKNQDLNLTTWTTAVAAGDIIRFNVDSASTVTRITLSIAGIV